MPRSYRLEKRLYSRRRNRKEFLFRKPWHKRAGARAEKLTKRLLVGLLSRVLSVRSVRAPLDPSALKRILILRPDALGDMVLTTPLWQAIHVAAPHIEIGIVGNFRNLPVIEHDPDIRYRYALDDYSLRSLWSLRRQTRRYKWDVVFPMIYDQRTKMACLARWVAPGAVTTMLLSRRNSVEHYRKLFSIVTQMAYDPGDLPILEQMKLHLESTIALQVAGSEWRPRLFPDKTEVESAQSRVQEILCTEGCSSYVILHLEAKNQLREFGFENALQLSRLLRERIHTSAVLWTGSARFLGTASKFLEGHNAPGIRVFETPSIDSLIGIVRQATLVIAPDTSIIHIASAESRPVVGLYPARNQWPPYRVPNRVLTPREGEPVSTIPIEDVLHAAESVLAESRLDRCKE